MILLTPVRVNSSFSFSKVLAVLFIYAKLLEVERRGHECPTSHQSLNSATQSSPSSFSSIMGVCVVDVCIMGVCIMGVCIMGVCIMGVSVMGIRTVNVGWIVGMKVGVYVCVMVCV
jgi:hypothetical protein